MRIFCFYRIVIILISCVLTSSCNTTLSLNGKKPVFYPPIGKNPRIQFLTTLSDSSKIGKPYGITTFEDKIFVADSRASAYLIIDDKGKIIKKVGGKDKDKLSKPINIQIDSEGNRFITDTGRKKLFQFDKHDHFVKTFGSEKFTPADVYIFDDKLFVSDVANHQIRVFDKDTAKLIGSFGKIGSKKGELFYPTHISSTQEGDLIISDSGNYRLQIFNKQGKVLKQIGEAGRGFGQFARPKGVATDNSGNIFVVDAAFENVQMFDANGNLLLVFGEPGDKYYNINLPADIDISYNNVEGFSQYADARFSIEYLILITSQFGPNKISVYGFGKFNNK